MGFRDPAGRESGGKRRHTRSLTTADRVADVVA